MSPDFCDHKSSPIARSSGTLVNAWCTVVTVKLFNFSNGFINVRKASMAIERGNMAT